MTAYGSTTYAYNGDGLRTSKTTGRTTEPFTWQPQSPNGSPSIIVDGTTDYIDGPDGLPLEQISGSTVLNYLHDATGSTRALTTSTGAVTATSTYGPYGNVAGSTGTATNPFGYAGSYTDIESGLLYLQHRYYDPASAQFTSVDPLVNATSAAYNYATDDPADQTDPTGLGGGLFGSLENWEVGLFDQLSFGLTREGRNLLGGDNVDYCSGAYRAGSHLGIAVGLAIPVDGEVQVGARVAEAAAEDSLQLYRFGAGPQSAERLSAEAENAVANGFPYGVSTSSRLPSRIAESGEYGSAHVSAIREAGLGVEKSGKSPFHYTVTFAQGVDQGQADIFNRLFFGEGK